MNLDFVVLGFQYCAKVPCHFLFAHVCFGLRPMLADTVELNQHRQGVGKLRHSQPPNVLD